MEIIEDAVKVGERGQITLPIEIRRKENIKKGDILIVKDIGGSVNIRKANPEMTLDEVMNKLGKALRESGYDTREKVEKLMKEVKREVADEWLKE